jgi:hypothetical protein
MPPLRRIGYLVPSVLDPEWHREPDAVGFDATGSSVAVWRSREAVERKLVTWHGQDKEPERSVVLRSAITPTFVQSLPNEHILLVSARRPIPRRPNAQIWDEGGSLKAQGDLDDAIEHVSAMEDGSVWVGYFDEKGGSGPGSHGLVRFTRELTPAWKYPFDRSLPDQFDCETLNVSGGIAWTCSYTSFHRVSVENDSVYDHGPAPHHGATGLLIEGDRGALVGGYGPDYDLVVPFVITSDGVVQVGRRGRIVMPDGLEMPRQRWSCRSGTARTAVRSARYEVTLASIFDALV